MKREEAIQVNKNFIELKKKIVEGVEKHNNEYQVRDFNPNVHKAYINVLEMCVELLVRDKYCNGENRVTRLKAKELLWDWYHKILGEYEDDDELDNILLDKYRIAYFVFYSLMNEIKLKTIAKI